MSFRPKIAKKNEIPKSPWLEFNKAYIDLSPVRVELEFYK